MGALYGFIIAMGATYGFITGMGALYDFFTAIGAHTFLLTRGPKFFSAVLSADISSTFFYFFRKGFVSNTCDEKEENKACNLEKDITILVCKYKM